ncbi:MAG: SMC family ATPase [Chloroflexi bacterium]|nr:SMC family ATPase [Chloroflexota bacterium]
MIPIKLAVRNFMPYRDNVPPLYFTDFHTASICGDNGSGKSSLIDAITWALWGKARSKGDDDLIHLGQIEMAVEFDFAVGEQVFRVIRKHSKPKRQGASGQSSLDLLVASGDGFKVISGNSISETERKIKEILHMDYDTFVHSAFLRQDHADDFTRQAPAKRKEVLANILELSRYDKLEEQARELAKQQATSRTLAESAIQDINNELVQKPTYEAELEQVRSEIGGIGEIISGQETRLNDLRQKKEQLKERQSQLARLEQDINQTAEDLKRWEAYLAQRQQTIKEYEALDSQRAAIEEGYAQLIGARQTKDEFDQKLTLVNRLNQRQHQLEMVIMQSSQVLLREHTLTGSKLAELETISGKIPSLKNALQQTNEELTRLSGEEAMLRQERQSSQDLRTHIHNLESGQTRLVQEIAEIEGKLNLLLAESGAKCPLCETELGADGIKLIEGKYTAEKQGKAESLKTVQAELSQKKQESSLREGELSHRETKYNQERASIQSRVSLIGQQLSDAEKASSQIAEERTRLTEIEERLARKDFAISEQETLRHLKTELASLHYDAQQHEQLRQDLQNLEQYEQPKRKLEEADRLVKQEREATANAEEMTQKLRHSLQDDRQKRDELIIALEALPQLEKDLVQAETERQRLGVKQKEAQEKAGSIKGKLEHIAELEGRKKEKEELRSHAVRDESIYKELAQAFGKGGIQAWLIEVAFPEIETDANRLLGLMTDNRMHVKFEAQRPTKSGGVIETLDIKIADELGTRNYEMFSGGEAFRINLAIRIALSRLLARRTGAPLRTLIIDEGFGTQDSNGLEKLKEAITSIQDDFDKILVITHIDELRDAFPARIDVVKTPEGSTIEVS